MKSLLNKIKSMMPLMLAFVFFIAVSMSSCSSKQSGTEETDATTEQPAETEATEEHPSEEATEEEHPSDETEDDDSEGDEHPSDSTSSEE
ncbi:MAG: hypothetical protein OEW75_13075 [Cyclobacteriaceae bacterium]|nr:hypothetical protein [Cyclobacteriaceae bacterium]